MLTILQFDAASATVLDRLSAEGRLPTLAALRDRGPHIELAAPSTAFAAGAQHTLYSGVELEEHGLFYPFQWDAGEQRVHYMGHFHAPPPVWDGLGSTGTRTLAIDPYESRAPTQDPPGALVCGWQLHDRVVLREWSAPGETHRRLTRLFGRPEPVDEVFGLHRADEMLGLRRRLLRAPGRVADAATHLLGEQRFDLAWLTFCAAHVAGHQFFDLSQIDPAGLDADAERVLAGTLDDVYAEVDAGIGRVVDALGADDDLMVICPVGMELNTSRADMLPEMLAAVLDPPDPAALAGAARSEATERAGSIWRLRAALPGDLRAKVAAALPERVALDLTGRLEMRGVDWARTRAFAHPAENQGYVRLNLRGRERDGIVDPADADALLDLIGEGLQSFCDPDGRPAVAGVEKVAERWGSGQRSHQLPDLLVRWVDRPSTTIDHLRSDRFGVVRRHGVGSGRSGNHTEGDAWATIVPGSSRLTDLARPARLEDVAATCAALCGGDPTAMAGEPLLVP